MSKIYIPRLQDVQIHPESLMTVDVWQDWGVFDTYKQAEETLPQILHDIFVSGKYKIASGHRYDFCIEAQNEDDWSLTDFYEVAEDLEALWKG